MAFPDCQFQSCSVNSLKYCPKVPVKIPTIVGCNPNIILVLSTMVSFDNWVQVLAQNGWKSRHQSAEILWKSTVGKSSATKIECQHFHWRWVRHEQTVINLRARKFAEDRLHCQVLCWVWRTADRVIVVGVVICDRTVDFWDPQEDVVFRWVFFVQLWGLRTWRRVVL